PMHPAFLWSALAFYGLGIVLSLPSAFLGRAVLSPAAISALTVGLVLNGAELVIAAVQLHRLPVMDVQSALSFLAFNVALAFLLLYRRYYITWLGVLVLPFVFALTLAAALNPGRPLASSTLRGGWLVAHSMAMILGYTGLFLTFAAAVMYLMQEGELKSKRPRSLYGRLPSLEICDRLYDRSLAFGLICLSAGILTGCLWASRAWQGTWELDPKILATLFTWFIYLVLCSTRFSRGWRGRRSAYVAILGFAAVMITFLGASFLSSQHGYFPTISRMH
ncbi:MAG: cytochrome c biogenesis protein CcsA, partial [Terriglobia bacterium]